MKTFSQLRLDNSAGESLVGTNNWHFLVGDSNKEIEQHLGRHPITDRTLESWANDHKKRVAYCSQHHIPYLTFVVPDRLQPLKRYLPSDLLEAGVLDGLSTNGSKVSHCIDGHYLELLDHFTPPKGQLSQLYYKTDTHWSDLGALHFANFLHKVAPNLFSNHDAQNYLFAETVFTGDICKNDPIPFQESIQSLESKPAIIEKTSHPYSGRLTLVHNKSGIARKLLIFGNSYVTDALLQYLSEDFNEITYVFSNSFDYNLANAVAPDVIIYQTLERFTILPPNDSVHMSAFERASYLCATGRRPATSHRIENHSYNTLSEICLKVAAKTTLAVNDYNLLKQIGLQPLYKYCVVIIYYLCGQKQLALQLVIDDFAENSGSLMFIKYAQLLNAHKDVKELSLLSLKRKIILESTWQ